MGRVRCRFAGEVSSVEFLEGGVDILQVETDCRRDPFVGVVLNDLKDIDLNLVSLPAQGAKARENEAFAPGRNDRRHRGGQQPDFGRYAQVFDRGISTASDPGVDDPTTVSQ